MANFNYRRLLSERRFLRVAERARKLHNIKLVSIEYDRAELIFKTESGTTPGVFWTQRIQVKDLETHLALLNATKAAQNRFASYARAGFVLAQQPILPQNVYKVLLNSGVRVDCNCPANLYWGFRYIAWKKGYGIVPEHRRPKVRNRFQQGFVCKHLFAVLSLYPLMAKTVERKLLRDKVVRQEYPELEAEKQKAQKKMGTKYITKK